MSFFDRPCENATIRIFSIAALAGLAGMLGCGDWPPVVNTAADVRNLASSTKSIRARGLVDADIPSIGKFHDLETLDFSGGWAVKGSPITDAGLAQIGKLDAPHLDTLTLGFSDNITDAGLVHLTHFKTLAWMGLPACPGVSDAGLATLATIEQPIGLDLRGSPTITDVGLQKLAAKTSWTSIELGGCEKITAAGVAKLQAALPNTRVKKDDNEWELSGNSD